MMRKRRRLTSTWARAMREMEIEVVGRKQMHVLLMVEALNQGKVDRGDDKER